LYIFLVAFVTNRKKKAICIPLSLPHGAAAVHPQFISGVTSLGYIAHTQRSLKPKCIKVHVPGEHAEAKRLRCHEMPPQVCRDTELKDKKDAMQVREVVLVVSRCKETCRVEQKEP
jgi:hypothetical protein